MSGEWTTAAIFGDDATSLAGTKRLKSQIERYWSERGFAVEVRLKKLPYLIGARQASFTLESDLINGLPREAIKREQAA